MPEAVVLLPPSDSKRPGGRAGTRYADERRNPRANRFPQLDAAREEVAGALHKALEAGDGLEELLDAKGALLTSAVERNALLYEAPVFPAAERYGGAFYRHLAWADLSSKAQDALAERGLIVSGLLGLAAPTDLVPDYKLGLEKTVPGIGELRSFWRARLSPLLDEWAAAKLVWNLLSTAEADAWAPGPGATAVYTVRFVERRGGRERALPHTNRALKGAFARHLATRGWALASAEKFEIDGYRFDADASGARDGRGELVFSKGA